MSSTELSDPVSVSSLSDSIGEQQEVHDDYMHSMNNYQPMMIDESCMQEMPVEEQKPVINRQLTYTDCTDLEPIDWKVTMHEHTDCFHKLPILTEEEKVRTEQLTSLLWNEFYNEADPSSHLERSLLFKIHRIREAELEHVREQLNKTDGDMKRKWEVQHFNTVLSLGHITVLGQDYPRALSAYQKALKLDPQRFSKDPGAYYGLALVYFHFKKFKAAAECFNIVLYTHKEVSVVPEIHARLGSCYRHLENYELAIKHYQACSADHRESFFHSKIQLRICIASCYQCSGQLDKAYEDYKKLASELSEIPPDSVTSDNLRDRATVLRELGWVCYLFDENTIESRNLRLKEAEQYLTESRTLEPNAGKTYYYLGRCYGETKNRAHDAFVNYRQAIDKSEGDADTWCSIGLLYQDQSQPMDALQAFICAVELDPEHSPAWTNLGQLYLSTNQFVDALECFKNSLKFRAIAPNPLKQIIVVLEKELKAYPVLMQSTPPNNKTPALKLPCLKEAWLQPIPSELRQRQTDFILQKQYRYKEGSATWRFPEDMLRLPERSPEDKLDHQTTAIFDILNYNKDDLKGVDKQVHCKLEKMTRSEERSCVSPMSASDLPSQEELDDMKPEYEHEVVISHPEGSSVMKNELQSVVDGLPVDEAPKSVPPLSELPRNFSLLAPLRVNADTITADRVYEMCSHRTDNPALFVPIFEEEVLPPELPQLPNLPRTDMKAKIENVNEYGIRPTPLIMVESRGDAALVPLQLYLQSPTCPIAVVRNLTGVLRMDLSLFSTKSLLEVIPDKQIEVRTQHKMPTDQNLSSSGMPTWDFFSRPGFTTTSDYANYQGLTFKYCLKEEAEKLRAVGAKYAQTIVEPGTKRPRGPNSDPQLTACSAVNFATNIDVSDSNVFGKQLKELQKLPAFCRPGGAADMLSHLGYTILGMNSVQMYMKVPQARTPAHVENNCFASVNVNIGPGECEWFAVPYEYWGAINQLCDEHKVDFLKGSWWPDFDELVREGIPVFRFTQKAGDLVWVGPGCIHWVQSLGWCNNIAWNVGPITPFQLEVSLKSYEWNRKSNFKSLVPMQFLSWQLAKNIKFTNQQVLTTLKGVLVRSLAYSKMVAQYAQTVGKVIKFQPRVNEEVPPYCTLCDVEVFNILFVKSDSGVYNVFCISCAKKRRFQQDKEFFVLQQYSFTELARIFDRCQLNYVKKVPLVA